jgi:hypothetical protein
LTDPTDALELSIAAAMARQYETDARSFVRSLADLIESALPGEATIQRAGLFGGDKRPIRKLEIDFVDDDTGHSTRYAIEDSGKGPLTATQTKVVRGIALKTENIPFGNLIVAVGRGIARRAANNKATRNALASLL